MGPAGMTRLAAAVLLSGACAHSRAFDRTEADGVRGFTLERGHADDFASTTRVCVVGQDVDTKRDLTADIVALLAARAPALRNDCTEPFSGLWVEYQGSFSACTHCPPPYRGPRFGSGSLQGRGRGHDAMATWVDTHGGGAQEAARRFAEDLVALLADPGSQLHSK